MGCFILVTRVEQHLIPAPVFSLHFRLNVLCSLEISHLAAERQAKDTKGQRRKKSLCGQNGLLWCDSLQVTGLMIFIVCLYPILTSFIQVGTSRCFQNTGQNQPLCILHAWGVHPTCGLEAEEW